MSLKNDNASENRRMPDQKPIFSIEEQLRLNLGHAFPKPQHQQPAQLLEELLEKLRRSGGSAPQ